MAHKKQVKAPKVPIEPIETVSMDTVSRIIKTCQRGSFTGNRDAANLLCRLDTGARANEFLSINLEDVNQACGDILILQGKGHKPRTVNIRKQSGRALRRYLASRRDKSSALWVTHPRFGSDRLTYYGLREVLTRRAADAQVEEPSLHDFRRAFALAMLRNGIDFFTLAKLMGHEGFTVLQRYLKQTNLDTEEAHRRAGQVDNAGL